MLFTRLCEDLQGFAVIWFFDQQKEGVPVDEGAAPAVWSSDPQFGRKAEVCPL